MSKKKEYNQKHLTTTQRIQIEKGLNERKSFATIAKKIDKHPSTVIKEVKKYRTFPPRENAEKPLRCDRYRECQMRFLCDNKDCIHPCKNCFDTTLTLLCVFHDVHLSALIILNQSVLKQPRPLMFVMAV